MSDQRSVSADAVLDYYLIVENTQLADHMDGDVIFLKSPMMPPLDDAIRRSVDDIQNKKEKLIVVIETTGGSIEVVERIVRVFRRHYEIVEFIVPNYAYSAGTVLVMSGDEIYMDYHSVLGPIDPQFESENGDYVPGMGYLAKYEELVNTINSAQSLTDVRAESTYLVQKFDPAKLFHIEQAIEHSKSLLREWLPRYKFKDWKTTNTRNEPVTEQMKEERANQVAEILGKATHWHSHGRGISITELRSEAIKLKVEDYSDDKALSDLIWPYYSLVTDYMGKLGWNGAIHTKSGLKRVK